MAKLNVPAIPIPIEGMNNEAAQHQISDAFCFWMQDLIAARPGILERRGKVHVPSNALTSLPSTNSRVIGACTNTSPDGLDRIAVFYFTTTTGAATALSAAVGVAGGAVVTRNLATISAATPLNTTAFPHFVSSPALDGGTLIGILTKPTWLGVGSSRFQLYWRGASKPDYSAGTAAMARNIRTVTGTGTSWLANVEPGMFLIYTTAGSYLLAGVVSSVDSNTQVTLEKVSLMDNSGLPGGTGSYVFTSFRGLSTPAWSTALVTTSTTSTTVTGSETNWQNLSSTEPALMTSQVYRATDFAYIGQVSSVNNNISLTLVNNALIALNLEEVVLVPSGTYSVSPNRAYAHIPALWKGFQFLANQDSTEYVGSGLTNTKPIKTSRVWIFGPTYPDVTNAASTTGSFVDLQTNPGANQNQAAITGVCATQNAVLLFRSTEVWELVGDDTTNFQIRQLFNDGTDNPMTIQSYNGGCVWAGRRGIYYYDGTRVNDLTSNRVKRWYTENNQTQGISATPSLNAKAWATLVNDYYILSPEQFSNQYASVDGVAPISMAASSIVVNLKTGAIGIFKNVSVRAAVQLPNLNASWWFSTPYSAQSGGIYQNDTGVKNFDAASLVAVDSTGADEVTLLTGQQGPRPYFESKLYDMGNPELKKLFRQFQLWMINPSDTVPFVPFHGVDRSGATIPGLVFPVSASWVNRRFKFLARNTHLGFALYTTAALSDSLKIGATAIGFKVMRPGRV